LRDAGAGVRLQDGPQPHNLLRTKAKAALGPRFDFKRFNDALVLSGNVPLTLLDRIVDRHVAEMKG
jgi:uncharacterized protein (DUF885 family)